MRWTRTALAARVTALAERHEGRELVDALVAFADTLEPEDREALQEILLARADAEQIAETRRRLREPKPSLFRWRRRREGR